MVNCLKSQITLTNISPGSFLILLFVIFGSGLSIASSGFCQQDFLKNQGQQSNNATKITSQKMKYHNNKNLVEFLGNVHVQRKDFELWSEKLTIYLTKETNSSSEKQASGKQMQGAAQFNKIVAQDKVRLKMDEYNAQSLKATYKKDEEVIILEGDVVLQEKKNRIKGDKVRFYLKENRSEVLSGPQKQVEALFYSDSQDKNNGQD